MPEFISFRERLRIESFNRLGRDVVLGVVEIDPARCTGCGYCVRACAAGSLELHDKKARQNPAEPICHACANCAAICPEHAITLKQFFQLKRYFRYLDRGTPSPPRKF